MTAPQDWDDDDREPDDDDDWPGDDCWRDPDPEDAEIARSYDEYYEHCDDKHDGGDCDCTPTLAAVITGKVTGAGRSLVMTWCMLRVAARHPRTVRVGPVELTVRFRAGHHCQACGGKGWFYTLMRGRTDDRPPGYNGVGLCGCGSVIRQLADTRRMMRRSRGEPPF